MRKKINISSEHLLNDLTGVSATVMPLVRQLLGSRKIIELEILRNWSQIVGDELARYSLPQKITFRKNEKSNGCLSLQVLNGAFALEITQQLAGIIDKINLFFGYSAVAEIKIIQTGNLDIFKCAKKNAVNIKKSLVTTEEDFYITSLTSDIKSSELRHAAERLGRAVFSNHKQQETSRGENN